MGICLAVTEATGLQRTQALQSHGAGAQVPILLTEQKCSALRSPVAMGPGDSNPRGCQGLGHLHIFTYK